MRDEPTRYLVCYDLPDDARRAKLAKFLDTLGDRLQFSVFECWLGAEERQKLVRGVEEIIDPVEDRVSIYVLCKRCRESASHYGHSGPHAGDEEIWVL